MPDYQEISYTLTEEEMVTALKISGYYKVSGKRTVIQTILLGVLFVFFLSSFFMNHEWFNLAMSLVCLIVIGFYYLVPFYDRRKKAKLAEKNIRIRLYPTVLYYYGEGDTIQVSFKMANIRVNEKQKMIAVLPKEGGFLAIPFRALPEERKVAILHDFLQVENEMDRKSPRG